MTPFYQDDYITIYHGDCEILLPTLIGVRSIVSDPPYGIKRFEKGFGYSRFKGYGAEVNGLKWDKKPDNKTIALLLSTGKYHILWGANNFELPASQAFLVWNKKQTVKNFADAELAYCDLEQFTAKTFEYSIHRHNATNRQHPTEKPVPLMRWCLGFLPSDAEIICDPYAGSGSTLVAAKELGLKAIGIDVVEKYCEVSAKRCANTSPMLPALRQPNKAIQAELLPLGGNDGSKQTK